MIFDWQSRRTVELNMTFEQIGLLTIPDPGAGHWVRDRAVAIAARLASCDDRYIDWASEVGVPVGSATSETIKQDLICELRNQFSLSPRKSISSFVATRGSSVGRPGLGGLKPT